MTTPDPGHTRADRRATNASSRRGGSYSRRIADAVTAYRASLAVYNTDEQLWLREGVTIASPDQWLAESRHMSQLITDAARQLGAAIVGRDSIVARPTADIIDESATLIERTQRMIRIADGLSQLAQARTGPARPPTAAELATVGLTEQDLGDYRTLTTDPVVARLQAQLAEIAQRRADFEREYTALADPPAAPNAVPILAPGNRDFASRWAALEAGQEPMSWAEIENARAAGGYVTPDLVARRRQDYEAGLPPHDRDTEHFYNHRDYAEGKPPRDPDALTDFTMWDYRKGVPPRDDAARALYREWAQLDADDQSAALEAQAEGDREDYSDGEDYSAWADYGEGDEYTYRVEYTGPAGAIPADQISGAATIPSTWLRPETPPTGPSVPSADPTHPALIAAKTIGPGAVRGPAPGPATARESSAPRGTLSPHQPQQRGPHR